MPRSRISRDLGRLPHIAGFKTSKLPLKINVSTIESAASATIPLVNASPSSELERARQEPVVRQN